MHSRMWVLAMAVAALLLVGCSKQAGQDLAAPKSANLGTVELSYGVPSRHDLGDKAVCVLTARAMDGNNIALFATLEKSGKEVSSTRAAPVAIDRPLQIAFGNTVIDLIPHVK